MKRNLTYALSLLVMLMLGSSVTAQVQTFQWQNVDRQYIVQAPSSIDRPLPIVFFLHGLGDNVTNVNNSFNLSFLAEYYNWVFVAPQALSAGYGTMWNAGLMNSSTDDSGFLMALLDTLCTQYPIDQDSVFFTGFSMGGFMTHRMAIEHGDRINACAPVSGLITSSVSNEIAAAPVRMLHIHGTSDNVVGYNGYSQYFNMSLGLGVDAILDYWKIVNGFNSNVMVDTLPDLKDDGLLFVRYKYDCDTELEHLKVIGGTHDWYVSGQNDVGYMEYIHDFFVGSTDGVKQHEAAEKGKLMVSPNPTTGLVTVVSDKAVEVSIVDVMGKVLDNVSVGSGSTLLDLSDYADGVYFIRTSEGLSAKVIVNK
mgnify:CR=1 FL=1